MSPYDEFEPTGEDVVIDVAAFDAKISGSPDHFDDELGYPSFDDEEIDALFAALKHPQAEAEFGNLGRLLGEVRSSLFDRADVAISAELAEYISVDDTMLALPVFNGDELAREVALVDVDEMLRVFTTTDDETTSAHDETPNRIHRVLAGAALAMAVVGGLVGAQHLRPATDDTVAGLLSDGTSDSSQSDEYGEAAGSEQDQDGHSTESLWSGVVRGALYGGLLGADVDGTADASGADAPEWMSAGSGSVGRDASDSDTASPADTRRASDSSNADTGRSRAGDTARGAESVAASGRGGANDQGNTRGSLMTSSGTADFKAAASTGVSTKGPDDKPWSTGSGTNTELPPAATENTTPPTAAAGNAAPSTAAAENTAPSAAAAGNTTPATAAAGNTEPSTAAMGNTAPPESTAPPEVIAPEVTAPPENTAPPESTAPEVTAPPENTAPPEVTAPEVAAPPDTGSPDIQTEEATTDKPGGGSGNVLVTEDAKNDNPSSGSSGSLSGEDLEPVLVAPPPVPPYIPSTLEPQPEEQSNLLEAMGSGAGSPPPPPQASGAAATSAPEIGQTVVITDPAMP